MTLTQAKDLQPGTLVRHKHNGILYRYLKPALSLYGYFERDSDPKDRACYAYSQMTLVKEAR